MIRPAGSFVKETHRGELPLRVVQGAKTHRYILLLNQYFRRHGGIVKHHLRECQIHVVIRPRVSTAGVGPGPLFFIPPIGSTSRRSVLII